QVAVLSLEGCLRPQEQPTPPIRAPIPKHAMPMLNQLLLAGSNPVHTVEQFHDELVLTRNQPSEITTAQRVAHLVLLGGALLLPFVIMFVVPTLSTAWMKFGLAIALNGQIQTDQLVLSDLQNGMRRDFLFALLQPDPMVRAHGLVRYHTDMRLAER